MNIPYFKQLEVSPNRMCGAAALCMVYGAFDSPKDQLDIWNLIKNNYSSANTKDLCLNLLGNGFDATVLRVKLNKQIDMLKMCNLSNVRVILNHRLSKENLKDGHFTVLVNSNDKYVTYHDPQFGPNIRVSNEDFSNLWKKNREVTGRIMIVISKTDPLLKKLGCGRCGKNQLREIKCPYLECRKPINLVALEKVSCLGNSCNLNLVQDIICPHCDRALRV